jgi:hypothetical protein
MLESLRICTCIRESVSARRTSLDEVLALHRLSVTHARVARDHAAAPGRTRGVRRSGFRVSQALRGVVEVSARVVRYASGVHMSLVDTTHLGPGKELGHVHARRRFLALHRLSVTHARVARDHAAAPGRTRGVRVPVSGKAFLLAVPLWTRETCSGRRHRSACETRNSSADLDNSS